MDVDGERDIVVAMVVSLAEALVGSKDVGEDGRVVARFCCSSVISVIMSRFCLLLYSSPFFSLSFSGDFYCYRSYF